MNAGPFVRQYEETDHYRIYREFLTDPERYLAAR